MPRKAPAPAKVQPAKAEQTVTNSIKGTRLHLGDGRVLEYGESDEVPADLAELLIEQGQAK